MSNQGSLNKCHLCGGKLGIRDSRPSNLEGVLRRRVYACQSCDNRFATHETAVSGISAPDDSATHARDKLMRVLGGIDAVIRSEFPSLLGGKSSRKLGRKK